MIVVEYILSPATVANTYSCTNNNKLNPYTCLIDILIYFSHDNYTLNVFA